MVEKVKDLEIFIMHCVGTLVMCLFYSENDLDFLPFRVWIGLWTTLILLLVVAFDLSALVRYITRFTEESFACLIAIIFIVEAFKKLAGIFAKYPVNTEPDKPLDYSCMCYPNGTNGTYGSPFDFVNDTTETLSRSIRAAVEAAKPEVDLSRFKVNGSLDFSLVNWTAVSHDECTELNATLVGTGCDTPHYVADVSFLSIILFLFTFGIAFALTHFKNTQFFPTFVSYSAAIFFLLAVFMVRLKFHFHLKKH